MTAAPRIHCFTTPGLLYAALAAHAIRLAQAALARSGRFDWVLSGGHSPEPLYAALAAMTRPGGTAPLDWEAIHLWFTDERCVPPSDPASNYGMVKRSLLDHLEGQPPVVHRIEGELAEPLSAAREYESVLEREDRLERGFDWVLLGLGTDGHTASIFPDGHRLMSPKGWAFATSDPHLGLNRVSLSEKALRFSSDVDFLVLGAEKAAIVSRVLLTRSNESATRFDALHLAAGEKVPTSLPAERMASSQGRLGAWIDAEAAGAHSGFFTEVVGQSRPWSEDSA